MLYIASDHAGYPLKEKIKIYLAKQKIKFVDLGTNSTDSVDASDYAIKAVTQIKKNVKNNGILICGSGLMMSMAANRFKGIRAALAWTPEIARQAREHNDANILVLPGRESVPKQWPRIITTFLKTKTFKKAKYLRRRQKLAKI